MKCRDIQKMAPLYITSDVPAEQMADMQNHMETCPACAALIEEYSDTHGTIRDIVSTDREPRIPDDFSEVILRKALSGPIGQPEKHMRPHPRLSFPRKIQITAAAAVVILSVFAYTRNNHRQEQQMAERIAEMARAAETPEPTVMVDQALIQNPLLSGPHRLTDWTALDDDGIIAVLHKPDQLHDPETYVVDFIGEFNGSTGTDNLWSRLDREQLLARAGGDDNVYIVFYPMTDTRDRKIIAQAVKRKFRPYFNNGV